MYLKQEEKELTFRSLFLPFTIKKAIIFIVIIGVLVFFNSLFNGFVLDDNPQIIRNPNIHSILTIPNLFINQEGGQETMNYYRPLPLVFYSLTYSISEGTPFAFHLIQLIFYIANSILVFLILKKFLNLKLSFFLSLLFLIHPINEEVAVYIANLQDVLFMFFGLIALHLLWNNSKKVSYIVLANIFLLFSIFSKETGLVFFVISYLYLYLFKRNRFSLHIFLSSIGALIYLTLRIISHTPFQKIAVMPIAEVSFWQRMMNLPKIFFYYIQTFLFPKDLVVYHSWVITKISFENFLIPLFIDCAFLSMVILLCAYVIRKSYQLKKLVIFFLILFILGFIVHSQLILLDSTVADRFFYFPMIGLLALVGMFFMNLKLNKKTKTTLIILGILLLLSFSARTIVRNLDWQSQSVILSRDEKVVNNDYLLELLYGNDLIKNGKINEAALHINKATSLYPQSSRAWTSLGVIYYDEGKIDKARQTFLKAISLEKDYFAAYENLGLLIKEHESLDNARDYLRRTTAMFPNSWKLWYYRFIVEYKLGNYNEALLSAKYYFILNPSSQSQAIYTQLLRKQPIKIE